MPDSRLLSWFCTLSALLSDFNAASTSANSFISASSSQATLFDCIILDTNDQLVDAFGPEMKDNNDSNTVRVISSTFLNMLTMEIDSVSLLRELKADLVLTIAFWIVFFTIFLEVKYFLTSLQGFFGSATDIQEPERTI